MEVFGSKTSEDKHLKVYEKLLKTHLKSYLKQPRIAPIYRPPKTSRWGPPQQEILLSVDCQRSDFRPLCHRSTARWTRARSESRALWWSTGSVDRPTSQSGYARLFTSVVQLLSRSTSRSTRRRPGHKFQGLKHGLFYLQ